MPPCGTYLKHVRKGCRECTNIAALVPYFVVYVLEMYNEWQNLNEYRRSERCNSPHKKIFDRWGKVMCTWLTLVVGGLLIRLCALRITVESDDKPALRSFNGGICIKLARGNQDNWRI